MDIIKMRQFERARKIDTLIRAIQETFKAGRVVNYKQLVLVSCADLGLSLRTTTEYLDIAMAKTNAEKVGEEIVACQTQTT